MHWLAGWSAVGEGFEGRRVWFGAIVAIGAIAADLYLAWLYPDTDSTRWIPPLVALVVYASLAGWRRDALGLRFRPVQGFLFWIKVTALLAIGLILLAIGTLTFRHFFMPDLRLYVLSPEAIPSRLYHGVFLFPVIEELTYRFAFCTPLPMARSHWGTIIVCGGAFAALHFVYGNPGPDNFIAGYVLAWAYLKSGSILVPIALHALGNLAILGLQFATWWWLIGRF